MSVQINPFHDLYLTEAIGADRFVRLFSAKFVKHANQLFQPGNVVLQGLQGSGKTMLLNLLKPEIRLAYVGQGVDFPVPAALSRFVSAGINLRKSGILDFANLLLPNSSPRELQELSLKFGDFVNYWLIADLINTLEIYANASQKDGGAETYGVNGDRETMDAFARRVSLDPCWFGYLDGVDSMSLLQSRVRDRIIKYRKYINLNIAEEELRTEIFETKTTIGNPIARFADALRSSKVIDSDVNVFIRIDQYEQLPTLNTGNNKFGSLCQNVIHKAMASRDPRVSYRIGTRHYAWPERPEIANTSDVLENKRDFSITNIDSLLRRKENAKTWIFPEFAADIFRRRIHQTAYCCDAKSDLISEVFGSTLSSYERAEKYLPTPDSRRDVFKKSHAGEPAEWSSFIEALAAKDPLNAKFAEAWALQKGSGKSGIKQAPPKDGSFPWSEKRYWIKERSEQALLQLASSNRQQLVWSGKEDVLGLSGGNILVFLSICQHVWDAWLRANRNTETATTALPRIESEVQTQGIRESSEEWLSKLKEGNDSVRRVEFVRTIGQMFYRKLTDDLAMSYPGANGFSVEHDELSSRPDVHNFIKRCVEYGDLYEASHTSKQKGQRRLKYYLAPVLCPYFKIPYRHTKEPLYVSVDRVYGWITRDSGPFDMAGASSQGSLFEND